MITIGQPFGHRRFGGLIQPRFFGNLCDGGLLGRDHGGWPFVDHNQQAIFIPNGFGKVSAHFGIVILAHDRRRIARLYHLSLGLDPPGHGAGIKRRISLFRGLTAQGKGYLGDHPHGALATQKNMAQVRTAGRPGRNANIDHIPIGQHRLNRVNDIFYITIGG